MLNGSNEESLSDDKYKVKVENHSGASFDGRHLWLYQTWGTQKKRYNYSSCRSKGHHKQYQVIWRLYKDNEYHQIKVAKLQIRNFQRHNQKRKTRYREESYRVQQQILKIFAAKVNWTS